MLEIVIGMVFIFLLLSLLATTINEMITNLIFSLRGRELEKAIYIMLNNVRPTPNAAQNQTQASLNYGDKFYAHPLIDMLSKNQNDRPSYITNSQFSKVVLELLNNSNTGPVSITNILKTINHLPPGQTKEVLLSLLRDAQNDIDIFQTKIEDWYESIMERTTGWYKRRVQWILFIIGIIISIGLNADSIFIARTLATDEVARKAIVAQAEKFMNNQEANIKRLQPEITSPIKKDSLKLYTIKRDSLSKVYNELKSEEIAQASTVLGIGWNKEKLPKYEFSIEGSLIWLGKWLLILLGWLLTALAITLGAPFWFDILNKVMHIRNAGKRPDSTLDIDAVG
jgi:Na+-transporting methylmalonyl-CoA/oxaloacetate decarboxylase gamma subunit